MSDGEPPAGTEAPARDRTAHRVGSAAALLFRHALWQMLSGRGAFVALAALLIPAVLAALYGPMISPEKLAPESYFVILSSLLFLQLLLPLLGVAFAVGLVMDEVERGTLLFLVTRPVSKTVLLLAKFAAFLVVAGGIAGVSQAIVYGLLRVRPGGAELDRLDAAAAMLAALGVGVTAYGAVFLLVGTLLRKPLVVAVLFAFGWEAIGGMIPGQIRLLTVSFHLRAVMSGILGERPAGVGPAYLDPGAGVPDPLVSAAVLLGVAFVALALSVWNFRRGQYVMSRIQ